MQKLTVQPTVRQLLMFLTGGLLVSGLLLGSSNAAIKKASAVRPTQVYVFQSPLLRAFEAFKPNLLGAPTPATAKVFVEASIASTSSKPARLSVVKYAIQSGDTLSAIGEHYGTNVDSILSANPGVIDTELQVGQSLDIPTFKGIIYTVQNGDTASEIAQLFGVGLDEIANANNLLDPEKLQVGERLVLPGATFRRQVASVAVSRGGGDAARPAPAPPPPPSFIWPLRGIITSEYGPRWGGFHTGIDIAADTGTVAVASKPGKVIESSWDGGYGNCVIIDHGDGTKTRYGHASVLLVKVGDWVEQGQPVIKVGSTGHSTGPHLHFEVIVGDATKNPMNYLP